MSIETAPRPAAETSPTLAAVPEAGALNPNRLSTRVLGGAAERLSSLADNLANRRTVGQVGGDIINSGVESGRQLATSIGEKVMTGATGAAMHTERAISSVRERGIQGREAVKGFFADKKSAAQERKAARIERREERRTQRADAREQRSAERKAKWAPRKEALKAIGAVVITPVVAAALIPAAAGYGVYRGAKAVGEVAGKGKEAAKAAHAQHKENAEVRKTKRADAKVAYKQAGEAVKRTNQDRKARIQAETERQKVVRQQRREASLKYSAQAKAAQKKAKAQHKADENMKKSLKYAERSAIHEDRIRDMS